MIIVDGIRYNLEVEQIDRSADILDKYAQRTESGDLEREVIGVYFNYKLKLYSNADPIEYARLWQKLTEPVEFHTVTLPDEKGEYTFVAYVSGIKDKLMRQINERNYWTDLTVNFTAKSPARI